MTRKADMTQVTIKLDQDELSILLNAIRIGLEDGSLDRDDIERGNKTQALTDKLKALRS